MLVKKRKDGYLVCLCEKINDIFDVDEVKGVITKVYKNIFKEAICGIMYFDLYLDQYDNVLIEVERIDNGRKDLEIKIIFHLDNDFFYELDDLFPVEEGKNLYYYQKKFYRKINCFLQEVEMIKNSEFGTIFYGEEALEIVNKGLIIK